MPILVENSEGKIWSKKDILIIIFNLIYILLVILFLRAYKGLIQCNIRELNKKENLEKLSRLNYQNLVNRSNYANNTAEKRDQPKFNTNSIYEENSLISNDHSI